MVPLSRTSTPSACRRRRWSGLGEPSARRLICPRLLTTRCQGTSLRPGGRFAGQLFGERDSWAVRAGMTFHSREQAEARLAGFEVELFDEEEDDSTTVRGEAKHWHIFHVVVRKPG